MHTETCILTIHYCWTNKGSQDIPPVVLGVDVKETRELEEVCVLVIEWFEVDVLVDTIVNDLLEEWREPEVAVDPNFGSQGTVVCPSVRPHR